MALCLWSVPKSLLDRLPLVEREFATHAGSRCVRFASAPENLRLDKALEVFLRPDRVVLGVRDQSARSTLESVYAPFTDRVEWMSIESAEMTEHAINAFLAVFSARSGTLGEFTGELDGTEIYTLRRIVPVDRGKNWDRQ
jgi:UDP-glucose 6-dehydrogenase